MSEYSESNTYNIEKGERYECFLGKGMYGSVHLISRGGMYFARKIIPKGYSNAQSFQRELDIMSKLNNRYLLHLYGTITNDSSCWIDSEYCEGNTLSTLLVYADKNGLYLNNNTIKRFFSNLVHGIHFLHTHDICHRDLKPDNIFLSNSGELVIGDVGVSKICPQDKYLSTIVGTPMYTPKEIYYGSNYTLKFDVYGLGFILYALCYNKPPNYYCKSHSDLKRFYDDLKIDKLPPHIDERIYPLFMSMIQPETKRPDIYQIADNEIIKESIDQDRLLAQFKYFCFRADKTPNIGPDSKITAQKDTQNRGIFINRSPRPIAIKLIDDNYFHLSINLIPAPPPEGFNTSRYGYIGFYCAGMPIPSTQLTYDKVLGKLMNYKFITENSRIFSSVVPLERYARSKNFSDRAFSYLKNRI